MEQRHEDFGEDGTGRGLTNGVAAGRQQARLGFAEGEVDEILEEASRQVSRHEVRKEQRLAVLQRRIGEGTLEEKGRSRIIEWLR